MSRVLCCGFLILALAPLPAQEPQKAALEQLAQGAREVESHEYTAAIQHLKPTFKRLPELADYTGYLTAAAQFELGNFDAVEHELKPVWDRTPSSPLLHKAVILLANTYLHKQQPKKAVDLVRKYSAELKEPESEILLAHAEDAMGNGTSALARYQKILVEYPTSQEALDAGSDPARVNSLSADRHLARCVRLLEGDIPGAKRELENLIPHLSGASLDVARVKLGAAELGLRNQAQAYAYLKSLKVAEPEADAERLYYILRCARRLDRTADFKPAMDRLAVEHPSSPWRMKALMTVGDYYFVQNDMAAYEPLYRACAESFQADARAVDCQWRYAWAEYIRRRPSAADLFRTLVARFPASDKVPNALYYFARLEEGKKDFGAARVYYQEINTFYPNFFYATLARERLKAKEIADAPPSPAATAFLKSVSFPLTYLNGNFAVSAAMRVRTQRARLLAAAGLDDLAESELRFGAKHDGQPEVAAVELAELAAGRNAPDRGIQYIKQLIPNYLRIPIDTAPDRFWKFAFPLPFRETLEQYSKEHSLDTFIVAALVRQESEFNPRAVSRSNAYGLAQLLPSTGRDLSRRLNVRGFRSDMLFRPEVNLQMGTYFLRTLIDHLQGNIGAALASYNAGPSRVVKWMNNFEYREPAEFIENIPFDETRNYVQAILRNADMYRRLYAPKTNVAVSSAAGAP